MIKRVDRYIGRAAVLGTLAVWLALVLLLVLFNLLDELRDTEGGYGTADALWFVFLTLPRVAYTMFPVSALLGTLVGVGALAEANELVAFRTAGVSRLRIAGAALGGILFLTVPVVIMGEYIAPAAEQQARGFRLNQLVGRVIIGGPHGTWMRDGSHILNIQLPVLTVEQGRQSMEFQDVVIYSFGERSELERVVRAGRAAHDGSLWRLEDVAVTDFDSDGARFEQRDAMPWESEFQPELLDSAVNRPQYLSLRSLWRYISYLGQNGLDSSVYRAAFWDKLVFPLTVVSLVLLAMPFVFGSARQQNLGVRLFVGMTLGGLVTIVGRAVENLGEAEALPPSLAALAIPVALSVTAILVLRRSV
ncbi:MAG: LPS export ABC transporter permease LptG [Xanthomonadales bacterium]|nr:LPS export ABC transporter permease LptG [Xanthomonadales bacterium]